MDKKIRIVTHNGGFHADDVFGVATLLLLFGKENCEVVRTDRNKPLFEDDDYVLDIGMEYDPERRRFDHHQPGGAGKRENGIQYASFGLIWKAYGEKVCGSKKIADRVDAKLVQTIDAPDNGINIFEEAIEGVRPYTIGAAVAAFEPTWKDSKDMLDATFFEAVNWAQDVLEREIKITTDWIEGEERVENRYQQSDDKQIIVLKEHEAYGRSITSRTLIQYPEVFYVVHPRPDVGSWQVTGIDKNENTFDVRKEFPNEWGGKRDEELVELTGVSDAIFCHRGGFMCVASSREGVIKLAQLALVA